MARNKTTNPEQLLNRKNPSISLFKSRFAVLYLRLILTLMKILFATTYRTGLYGTMAKGNWHYPCFYSHNVGIIKLHNFLKKTLKLWDVEDNVQYRNNQKPDEWRIIQNAIVPSA